MSKLDDKIKKTRRALESIDRQFSQDIARLEKEKAVGVEVRLMEVSS